MYHFLTVHRKKTLKMHAVKTKTDKTTRSLCETIESNLVQSPAPVFSFSGFTLESNNVIFEMCASTQPNAPLTPFNFGLS